MTKAVPPVATFECALFGGVVIERTDATVTAHLAAAGEKVVTLTRQGPRTRPKIPIGTRDPLQLTGTVNGRALTVRPGMGRLPKRTYRVELTAGESAWCLAPATLGTSRLLKGLRSTADNSFGDFTTNPLTGVVDVVWETPVTIAGKVVKPPEPSPEDALVGYAAAAAFGTGGLSLLGIIPELIAAIIPG